MNEKKRCAEDRLRSTAQLVAARLERLSADSAWAHRASGLRGSLLRTLEQYPPTTSSAQEDIALQERIEDLLKQGYFFLENAAREITSPHK